MAALAARGIPPPPDAALPAFSVSSFLGTCVVLFASFIGFDAVAQAGGEARDARDLARSITIAIVAVAIYYVGFTWAVYHAVPWAHIYREALVHDISAPGLLAVLLPPWLGLVILGAVTIAIIKVQPAVILANSRTLYAFSADRIFPAFLSRVHPRYGTPHHALTVTALAGSLAVIGCNVAGDFFLGVDLLVGSMLVNFLLMSCAILTFPRVNPTLYREVTFVASRRVQVWIAGATTVCLTVLLAIQVVGDVQSAKPWYMKFITSWIVVMAGASVIFWRFWRRLEREGLDPREAIFRRLPPE
jgi:amino acid transporter